MRSLTHTLSTAWLILALVVAPLQALAGPVAPGDRYGDCPMQHQASDAHGGMQHHHMAAPAAGDHIPHGCPKCSGHDCGSGPCSGTGCCMSTVQVCVIGAALASPAVAGRVDCPDGTLALNSIPPSRHYRPPV